MTKAEWKTLKFFTSREFLCKCGCGKGAEEAAFDLFARLEKARIAANVPFVIASGYRCPARNTFVGGVHDSAHMHGLAVDILTPGSEARSHILRGLTSFFSRIGIDKNFIHVDIDSSKPSPVVFLY